MVIYVMCKIHITYTTDLDNFSVSYTFILFLQTYRIALQIYLGKNH